MARPASVLDPRAYMQEGSETGVAVHSVGQTSSPILVGEKCSSHCLRQGKLKKRFLMCVYSFSRQKLGPKSSPFLVLPSPRQRSVSDKLLSTSTRVWREGGWLCKYAQQAQCASGGHSADQHPIAL
jgi:hypothetical protein